MSATGWKKGIYYVNGRATHYEDDEGLPQPLGMFSDSTALNDNVMGGQNEFIHRDQGCERQRCRLVGS